MTFPLEDCSEFGNFVITFTYSTLWVDHVYPHIIDTYMTPVILTLLCELITCIPTSLTPIWHLSYLLYFVSWSRVSPHHWHLYDTCHTYSTLWVDHVYPHVIDPYMTPVILTLLCELIMCIPTSLTPIWHLSYLLYFVSWSCVSPYHWHLYDTCHTYSTLWVDHVYPTSLTPVILTLLCELIICIPTSLTPIWHMSYLLYFWVDHVYPHIIDTYMTPVILTLLCELITCIPTSLTPIWHPSYLLYFVYPHIIDTYMTHVILTLLCVSHIIDTYMTPVILTLLCVSPHHWPLYDTCHTYSTLWVDHVYPHIIDTYHTYSTLWVDHVYPHIIDTYMTPVILTLLCVSPHHWHLWHLSYFTLCIPTSLTPIWYWLYLLYFVSWSYVSPHHWHLYDTRHTYSTLWVDHMYPHIIDTYMTPVILTLPCELIMCIHTSLTSIWHPSYLLYFVSWSCVSPHHWPLYDTCHTYSTLWVDHMYPHIIDTYMTPVILTLLCELIMCIPTSLTPIWHLSYLLYFVSWSYVSPHHCHLYDTCHTYSTLWVDHVYPHIIDTYMTPVIP